MLLHYNFSYAAFKSNVLILILIFRIYFCRITPHGAIRKFASSANKIFLISFYAVFATIIVKYLSGLQYLELLLSYLDICDTKYVHKGVDEPLQIIKFLKLYPH